MVLAPMTPRHPWQGEGKELTIEPDGAQKGSLLTQRKIKKYTRAKIWGNFKFSKIILTLHPFEFLCRQNARYSRILFQFTNIKYFTVHMSIYHGRNRTWQKRLLSSQPPPSFHASTHPCHTAHPRPIILAAPGENIIATMNYQSKFIYSFENCSLLNALSNRRSMYICSEAHNEVRGPVFSFLPMKAEATYDLSNRDSGQAEYYSRIAL
ncbi:hypothetical protein BDZ97DRAFT_1049021 [Flammula alnicola]|nr:hypothetical protein BDZ97DRAFT_1049021 [Flammula alnicola]